MDVDDTIPVQAAPIESDSEELVSVSELWGAISSSRFYQIDDTRDLFDELQSALASGECMFPMPLAPVKDEVGFNDETESDFGIDLPDDSLPNLNTRRVNLNTPVSPDNPMYPWSSKSHFITALLFSSPRLPFSEAQKKALLSWAKELGALDVPSLYSVNRSQERIRELVGNPTEKITSCLGNIFYLNDVGKAIAKDYSNPLTCFAMQDYPEDGGKGMFQVFNGDKMLFKLPSPPAARVGGDIYFVNELLQEMSGDYFIPNRFFLASYTQTLSDTAEKQLYALGRAHGFIVSDEQEMIPTSNFQRSFDEISANGNELACGLTESSNKYAKLVANPLREKSKGRIVYSVPLIIFMDDVSGNISKQWNKHHTIYMSNANLPCEMLEKEFCVRFVTSSPHAAPMEMMTAMQESIDKAAESGIFTWDCKDNEEVMLVPYGLFLGGDNPMQAEECSHAGLQCNYFCRTCEVGGTKEYKESDEGYKSIFVPGKLRTPAGTAAEIHAQFVSALCSGASEKIKKSTVIELGKKLRKQGAGFQAKPESEIKAILDQQLEDLLKGSALNDTINPLLGVEGFNVHQDTPTEILHTVLLGVVKYFWGQTVFLLEKAKLLDLFQTRRTGSMLRSFNHVFRLAYIVKHIATGGYWFDTTRKKWVQAGDAVLSYLDQHPEQARLLGIHVYQIIMSVAQKELPVLWRTTRCAKIFNVLELLQPTNAQYHHGISLVLSNGEKASLEGHVIFRDSLTSCSAIGRVQRAETTRTRPVVQHKPSPFYLLNIQSTIPEVNNAADKAAKKSGKTPGTESATSVPSVPATSKATRKGKEKEPQPHANPRRAATSQPAAGSSMPVTSVPTTTSPHPSSLHLPLPPQALPSHHLLHPPPMVFTWQSSPIPSPSGHPPSHPWQSHSPAMVPSQQLYPLPSPSASIPQPCLGQHVPHPPMHAGQFSVPPYQRSLAPPLPNPPSSCTPPLLPPYSQQSTYPEQLPSQLPVPVMMPYLWHSQAGYPHHDQVSRH
ncbi:hypothetical protein DFH29DRAFT_985782 [Suillus ampliporus]|nr:hypothetical protein DFH29DRAFT_985782 [Suillus ampliporus]